MKKLTAILLTLLLILSLAGCGVSSYKSAATSDMAMETPMAAPAEAEEAAWDYGKGGTTVGSGAANGSAQKPAKIIYSASFEMQTLDFDAAQSDIAKLVESVGGYFENKSMSNYSSDYRSASYTVRVPVEKYESFCNRVGELCHVTWSNSSAENISESYYDTEARLETAQIKLDRLQELLSKADNMADIITIESAISDTEYEIDSLSGTLRSYDSLVDYSTVYLNLYEAYKLSGTEDAPKTFGEKMANAFRDGMESAGDLLENIALWIAGSWLLIIIWAVIIIAVVLLIKRILHSKGKMPKLLKKKKTVEISENETKE